MNNVYTFTSAVHFLSGYSIVAFITVAQTELGSPVNTVYINNLSWVWMNSDGRIGQIERTTGLRVLPDSSLNAEEFRLDNV